jgi:hypothetical protein
MVYSFAGIGAALGMTVEDVFTQNPRLWVQKARIRLLGEPLPAADVMINQRKKPQGMRSFAVVVRTARMKPSCHRLVGKGDMEAEFSEFSGQPGGEAGAFYALEMIGAEVGIKDAAPEHPVDGGEDGRRRRRRSPCAGRVAP